MNDDTRIERQLPQILADLGAGSRPDYTDIILARTAAARQRPGWVFPERWLPMSAISQRLAVAPRLSWRVVAIAALLILALASAALYVGSQQRRLPAPFGPAANGVIPYVSGGDLYAGNPITGESRLLVGGPEGDAAPQFSPDGTRLAFIRDVGTTSIKPIDIYVARDDGSDPTRITPKPIWDSKLISWTPDGRSLVVISKVDAGTNRLDLYPATGDGSVETIATAAGMDFVRFRPPDGQEIMYRAFEDGKWGLFAMDADGSNPRTLAEPTVPSEMDMSFAGANYTADGSQILYQRGDEGGCCQLWAMNADGSDPHLFVPENVPAWSGEAVPSPDGTRIAFWWNPDEGPAHGVAVVRADGTGPVIDTGPALSGTARWVWAPDSSKILMIPNVEGTVKAYLLDPDGGPWTTVPWRSDLDIDWQRVAD
jgi:dipeptidyl aminopeptidase/acylaminoacyl peptidase